MSKNKIHRLVKIGIVMVAFVLLLLACNGNNGATSCSGEAGEYTCNGFSGHVMSISNVPEKVTPYMLYISPEDEEKLLSADRDGTGCVIFIAGDLAFYDDQGKLVTKFDPPVKLSYTLLESDLARFEECKNSLLKEGLVGNIEEVQFVPIYFSNNSVWKPFDGFSLEGGTATIEISTWGDQQAGGGTKP